MSSQSQLPNLDKIFRDDDEPDFAPSGGSNLAAIFGLQQKFTDSHSSKQTTSTKENTQYSVQQTASASKTEVLTAKAVHAFQLKNGEYISVGKLGIALTGNTMSKIYEIILYRTKQKYVSVVRITSDFVYTVQANNYASYYDTVNNTENNWSVLFDTNDSYVEFAIEVGLARYFVTQDKGENVIYQDLQPGNKDVIVKEGDNVHIKYFVGTEIVQPFKNNSNLIMSQTMTVEISPDNNWERTLLGCNKGLKRMLFLPPGKQISLGPGFPKERYVMLMIEIIDVRTSEESPPTSKTSSGRAAIISRMAKMGQSILPKMPLLSTTDSEDTEDDIPHKSPRYKRIEQSEGSLQKKNLSHDLSEERKVVQKITETRTEMPSLDPNTYQSLIAAPSSTQQIWTSPYLATVNRTIPTALDPLNMLLSETRITNAEIRMGMSKISDNIQKLLDKFHALELQNAATPTANDKAALDASLKMLLAFNASQMNARDNESPKSTDKDTLDENLRQSQSKINILENDLKKSQEEKESLLRANADLNKKLQELGTNLSKINNELKETKETLEVTLNTMNQYKEENINLQNRLCKYNRDQADETFKRNDIERKNKEIKQIMNRTYHALSEKFTNQSQSELPLDYVKSTIAKTIKHITLQVLYKDSDEESTESEIHKDVHPTVSKNIGKSDQQTEEHIERSGVTSASDNIYSSIKCIPSSVNTIAPMYENEPPPVPPDSIDEGDSE
ncbi:FK506-binding protein 15 [Pseudomyrmex gracilis]|uniref:FK506-binding protein 15 n=1 Tax=Pseudomyrmex gracilis TaxID=219809 RepID=UPI00099586F8|nr:FK506-binding protein 15 [Pseudomyrmex gracilis]